jgi:hypothetical protein
MKQFLKMLLLFVLTSNAFASVPLAPRTDVGGKIDMFGCMQANDFYIANFAVYPTSQMKDKKTAASIAGLCEDLPYLGAAQITIDLLDRDVRRKPVWVKVFDSKKNVIAQTEPKIEKQAVISLPVNFQSQGKYDVVLYVEDDDLHTKPEMSALHIPLVVAMTVAGEPESVGGFLKVALIVVVFAFAIGFLVNRQLKPKDV